MFILPDSCTEPFLIMVDIRIFHIATRAQAVRQSGFIVNLMRFMASHIITTRAQAVFIPARNVVNTMGLKFKILKTGEQTSLLMLSCARKLLLGASEVRDDQVAN